MKNKIIEKSRILIDESYKLEMELKQLKEQLATLETQYTSEYDEYYRNNEQYLRECYGKINPKTRSLNAHRHTVDLNEEIVRLRNNLNLSNSISFLKNSTINMHTIIINTRVDVQ